jgi:enoyl-CoA hydratase
METVTYVLDGRAAIVTIDRQHVRNAVDAGTARKLAAAFERFAADDAADVAILRGAGNTFCAGFDLHTVAEAGPETIVPEGDAPMGPSRMVLPKPAIAAVEGYAVAGGLELALLCDLRVAASDAVFGVFSRRFAVPLVDLGTIRLTGRPVGAAEGLQMGLVTRVTEPGGSLAVALELARSISAFPQAALRNDRLSAIQQWDLTFAEAIRNEVRLGLATFRSGETRHGAQRFSEGAGRHGQGAIPGVESPK